MEKNINLIVCEHSFNIDAYFFLILTHERYSFSCWHFLKHVLKKYGSSNILIVLIADPFIADPVCLYNSGKLAFQFYN
jgi:hypothetical protein